ncbi:phage tail domain-containing protein [Guptibacillus hwajinpoensis]|uniref:Phage tail protein n=1 Tax=Guptibacillus hwajinpoensis TaxID=208199 RepID=A0A0J6D2R9_9BACL|nr:phage tail domain-containing protein [Alkalihalobacillus macyae]KMM38594.1 hypothetical protein AB986_04765 [Alkalihalobacillus macyae]
MKSKLNFKIEYVNNQIIDMHDMGLWVDSFHIFSPDVERNTIDIPNRHGALLASSRIKTRKVKLSFTVDTNSVEDLDYYRHAIFQTFYSEKPYKIIRDVNPNRELFAIQDGEYDIENVTFSDGACAIELMMLDPILYSLERNQVINDPNGSFDPNITNHGTEKTFPTFMIDILKPTTFLSIISPEDYIQLGQPTEVKERSVEKEQLLLRHGCSDMTGFMPGTMIEGGTVAGSMYSNGKGLLASSYGTGTYWHGPAQKLELSETIQDFRVEATITNESTSPLDVGRVEISLLDDLNQVIGKMAMKDTSQQVTSNHGEMRAGNLMDGYYMINERRRTWNYMKGGLLSLQRIGARFRAYIAQQDPNDSNHHYARETEFFTDLDEVYLDKLAQIQVHLGAFGTLSIPKLQVQHLQVFKINSITEEEIPYIAVPGDQIVLNHKRSRIEKNGALMNKQKDLASNFFGIGKGESELKVYPSDAARVVAKWKEGSI